MYRGRRIEVPSPLGVNDPAVKCGARKYKLHWGMYIKNYNNWNRVKQRVEESGIRKDIRAGEIRWASVGVNLGSEIDGKGVLYARPVLIVHTIGNRLALVIPLTSKNKNIPGFMRYRSGALCINQVRVISHKRIYNREGKISDKKLQSVKDEIKVFFRL